VIYQNSDYARLYQQVRPHELVGEIVERLSLQSYGKVLDFACGPAFLKTYLNLEKQEYKAFDPYPIMYSHSDNCEFLKDNPLVLGEYSSYFDLIYVGMAFHLIDLKYFFKKAKNILKDNGEIIFFDYFVDREQLAWTKELKDWYWGIFDVEQKKMGIQRVSEFSQDYKLDYYDFIKIDLRMEIERFSDFLFSYSKYQNKIKEKDWDLVRLNFRNQIGELFSKKQIGLRFNCRVLKVKKKLN